MSDCLEVIICYYSVLTLDTIGTPANPILFSSREENIDPLRGRNRLNQALEAIVAVDVVTLNHLGTR